MAAVGIAAGSAAVGAPASGERAPGERAPGERAPGERAPGERAPGERAAAAPGGAVAVSGRGRWAWPVAAHVLAAGFVAPATPYAAGHRGIDLRAAEGTVVTAPADAVVRFSGMVVDRPVLTLDHGGGVLSSYEPVASTLPVGSVVGRGGIAGTVAAGGHCDGTCLHVGVRVDGDYVSPLLFFDRVPPAVLLPLGHR
jgi:murein DD-endopeptidase MepM/ murein hydrolase activator NlpD